MGFRVGSGGLGCMSALGTSEGFPDTGRPLL